MLFVKKLLDQSIRCKVIYPLSNVEVYFLAQFNYISENDKGMSKDKKSKANCCSFFVCNRNILTMYNVYPEIRLSQSRKICFVSPRDK